MNPSDSFMEGLAERMKDSFRGTHHADFVVGSLMPSKRAVEQIIHRLLHLMFPGFHDADLPKKKKSDFDGDIHVSLEELKQLLRDVLIPILPYNADAKTSAPRSSKIAQDIIRAFLDVLPAIRELLNQDVDAFYDGDPAAASREEIILAYPGIEAIAVQRLAHQLHILGVALIPRMMTEWAHSRTGIDIHPGAKIGHHFFIDHGTGVVIGETSEIGNHVKIYHSVTLGARSTAGGQQLRGKKRHPTIQDRVTIYPGATILGGETLIGEGSTIGGNVSLVDQIVPPRHLVLHEKRAIVMRPQTNH
ncbi:MAG: serine acetyltransferase [bacterium]